MNNVEQLTAEVERLRADLGQLNGELEQLRQQLLRLAEPLQARASLDDTYRRLVAEEPDPHERERLEAERVRLRDHLDQLQAEQLKAADLAAE